MLTKERTTLIHVPAPLGTRICTYCMRKPVVQERRFVLVCIRQAVLQKVEAYHAVREFANKSAASAASLDYVKFQAVIKSAASAASVRGGRASGRLDHDYFFAIFGRASGQQIVKISDSVPAYTTGGRPAAEY